MKDYVSEVKTENEDVYSVSKLLKEFNANSRWGDDGVEFWYARELQTLLGYSQWRNFQEVIVKAKKSCDTTKQAVSHHFAEVSKMVLIGVSNRLILDYKLTRYACYLIAQNGDSKKEPIAFAQTYFATQTERQEIQDAYIKGLNQSESILDNMGSQELSANWFIITQTQARLEKLERYGKKIADSIHFEVGRAVHNIMVDKPEELPTPLTNTEIDDKIGTNSVGDKLRY